MQRIRIKGIAAYQSTPAEYMRDMLRYDDGEIEAIWDYPDNQLTYHLPFTAIVQLSGYTPERWRSFGLVTDVLGDVGEYSPKGYTVDQWVADRSPVQETDTMAEYQIVTMNGGTGDWNPPVETFEAADDAEANTHAEEHYPELEWYILDIDGANING